MSIGRTLATTGRVLQQLVHDRRSMALLLVVPSALVGLFAWLFIDQAGVFDTFGPPMLTIFPFILMFVVTSVTTLRERRSGTLERLMTTPLGKPDFIAGYALAFSLMAGAQALVTVSAAVWLYDLEVAGSVWQLGLVSVVNGVLGSTLGLLASAFARTEFQAVQFMPVIVFPQILLGGVLLPRDAMPEVLHAISHWLPLSHAVDAVTAVAGGQDGWEVYEPVLIMVGFVVAAVTLASLTLRRRTP